jgi:hypothetical protein
MPAATVAKTQKKDTAVPPKEAPDPTLVTFSRRQWLNFFIRGNHVKLSDEFIRVLNHFRAFIYFNLPADRRAFINDFVENFLYFFCHPDFKIPQSHIGAFLALQPVIANVVALSDFGTTTPWVLRLSQDNRNFFKLLVLHNVRTEIAIDPARYFELAPEFASRWWCYYWVSAAAFCRKETHEKIRLHLKNLDDRFTLIGDNSRLSYFPVTYIAPECERIAKERLNRLAAAAFANVEIRNRPARKKIAIVSGRWYRCAVYTSLAPLIRSLAGVYDITLVNFGTKEQDIEDRAMFERIIPIAMKNHQMDLSALQDNEFSAAIYPDIGMNAESIFMSNIRLAPVQVAMYGHPTSTWGSKIDYFIGGRKVEDAARATANYSERLVLIPGMGVYPVYPDDFAVPTEAAPEDPFYINCGWTAQKVSWPLLDALAEVRARASKRVVFRIFPGRALTDNNGFIPFVKDIHSILGAQAVQVFPNFTRIEYLTELCRGAISLDSYPFGGFNTVIDALYCKKPMVVWEGDRAFNRFGAATLDIVGMPELIARTREEYIALTLRLIDDDDFRRSMQERAGAIDLKRSFATHEDPRYYRKAIDYLIENNENLKNNGSREPILIE